MKVRFKRSVNIRGVSYEAGREYEVDDRLGFWLIDRDIADPVIEELPEETPKAPEVPVQPAQAPPVKPATSYEKLMQLVGAHAVQIFGETGTGKSRLLAAICIEAQLIGKKVLYIDTEGSLPEDVARDLENYEYIGPDLDAMVERVRLAKMQRDQFDLLAIDSIGFPVLTAYASLPLDKRLSAILTLTNVFADAVRFARASRHEDLPAPEKMNLSIVSNQPVSEFVTVTKGVEPEERDPFGGKLSFIPKLNLRTEVVERSKEKSVFNLVVHKARNMARGTVVAQYTINNSGVTIKWLV